MKRIYTHIENESGLPEIKSGFKAPEGYFESFGERLQQRMESEKLQTRSKGLIFYLKPVLSVAAGLAIIVSVYLHYPANLRTGNVAGVVLNDSISQGDRSERMFSTYTNLISEGQFLSAISEMDEYDASKMPKEELVDYLASNCSDFEILNANK